MYWAQADVRTMGDRELVDLLLQLDALHRFNRAGQSRLYSRRLMERTRVVLSEIELRGEQLPLWSEVDLHSAPKEL